MQQLNPEHVTAVINLINRGPYFGLLSMKVSELGLGYAKVELEMAPKHFNPFGGIHGGVYSSLIDTAAFWAIYCDLPENTGWTSLDVQVDFLAPIQAGQLLVEGKKIKVGRSICIAEAAVFDGQGRYLAFGTSKMMVTTGVQTIDQAVTALGQATLPPKYIEIADLP